MNQKQPGTAAYSPFEKTIPDLARDLQSGLVTSVELTNYYLERIKVYDCVLNSIITINPNALKEAQRLDDMRKSGKIAGLLHGIPIILKDNINTFDMVTTIGAKAFEKLQPARDAFVATKLREAGAIIIGKSNLTEMAIHGMSISSMIGQTLNPYDLTRTPGGSSGGTGAAIAANFAAAGTGSDTVNSVRSPASANSLVGIRPTRGLVSRSGIAPCSEFQDQSGPIARTVTDAAILLNDMAGYDPADKSTGLIKDKTLPDYTSSLRGDGFRNKRIALLTTNLGEDPDVIRVVRQAVEDLKKLGAQVTEADIPELHMPALVSNNDVQRWEQKIYFNKYLKELGDRAPVKSIEEYVATGLITPSVAGDMAIKAAEQDPENNPEYLSRLQKNAGLKVFVEKYMRDNNIDAFFYPHQTVLVVQTNDPRGQTGRNGLLASLTGLPAITVPGGFSTPTGSAPLGVPIGVELMGLPFSDESLIQMAYTYEQVTKQRKAPYSIPDLLSP